jgi:hypothetical protein
MPQEPKKWCEENHAERWQVSSWTAGRPPQEKAGFEAAARRHHARPWVSGQGCFRRGGRSEVQRALLVPRRLAARPAAVPPSPSFSKEDRHSCGFSTGSGGRPVPALVLAGEVSSGGPVKNPPGAAAAGPFRLRDSGAVGLEPPATLGAVATATFDGARRPNLDCASPRGSRLHRSRPTWRASEQVRQCLRQAPPTGSEGGTRGWGHGDGRMSHVVRHTLRSSSRCFKAVVLSSF